jgi:hypothetical protein
MNEYVFRSEIAVVPRAEGGCNLIIGGGDELVYRKPMTAEEQAQLVKELTMSPEELNLEQQRRLASQHILVPNGEVPHRPQSGLL